MRKLHTTLYFGLSVFVSLISILIMVFFFRIIKNKNEHTGAVITILENKMTDKENASVLVKKIDELNITHQAVSSHFVDPTKIDNFVGYLENLGQNNGSDLSVTSVKASEKKNDNMISVEITISGQFPNVMKTIGLLENSPYQIYINSAYVNKIVKASSDGSSTKVETSKSSDWEANVSFNILSAK